MTEIEELLIQLIKIPSVSGGEREVAEFISSQLAGPWIKIRKQNVGEGRFNLVVQKGKSKKWLLAHMDTVPGVVEHCVTKDKIFGRGACDNKQSIAASIILARELSDINFLFTVGEEVDFAGARKAVEEKTCNDAKVVIVQEPTSFELITGQCGVISCVIETIGKEQHSSLKNPDNAIERLAKILAQLSEKGWTGFNIGTIEGGVAENVVAGSARAVISVRPRDSKEQKSIISEFKKLRAKVSIDNNLSPFHSAVNLAGKTATHFSEMGFFKNSVQFGAGDIRNAHTQEEYILRKDLNALPKKLLGILNRF